MGVQGVGTSRAKPGLNAAAPVPTRVGSIIARDAQDLLKAPPLSRAERLQPHLELWSFIFEKSKKVTR